MNDRILELAKEAGLSYVPSSNSGPLRVEYLFPELKKFAELIIQECSALADEHFGSAHFGMGISATMIKKHFGVKE